MTKKQRKNTPRKKEIVSCWDSTPANWKLKNDAELSDAQIEDVIKKLVNFKSSQIYKEVVEPFKTPITREMLNRPVGH
ncbi:MAG: hypothetical protein NUW37_07835 [Planctomycetes bacterium]|nr:hypothetical protein [Planctomycetota bacterium]